MKESLAFLMEIERDYRPEIMIRLRRAICEKYHGFRKADKIYLDRLAELENGPKRGQEEEKEVTKTEKVIDFITMGLFGKSDEDEHSIPQTHSLQPQITPQEKIARIK